MSEIITNKSELEKSLREIAQEKSIAKKPLSLAELDALIACYVPADSLYTEEPVQNDDTTSSNEKNMLTAAEIDNLLCYATT